MNEAKIIVTPMHPSSSLDKDENGISISKKEYKDVIRALLDLTDSRPNIMFGVCLCARFQTYVASSNCCKKNFKISSRYY